MSILGKDTKCTTSCEANPTVTLTTRLNTAFMNQPRIWEAVDYQALQDSDGKIQKEEYQSFLD